MIQTWQALFGVISLPLGLWMAWKIFNLDNSEIKLYLQELLNNQNKIMATQAELAQELLALKAQVEKSKAEVIAKVKSLEDALANAGGTTEEVDAALAALKAVVQEVDDLNPDAEPEPEPTPEEPTSPLQGE